MHKWTQWVTSRNRLPKVKSKVMTVQTFIEHLALKNRTDHVSLLLIYLNINQAFKRFHFLSASTNHRIKINFSVEQTINKSCLQPRLPLAWHFIGIWLTQNMYLMQNFFTERKNVFMVSLQAQPLDTILIKRYVQLPPSIRSTTPSTHLKQWSDPILVSRTHSVHCRRSRVLIGDRSVRLRKYCSSFFFVTNHRIFQFYEIKTRSSI